MTTMRAKLRVSHVFRPFEGAPAENVTFNGVSKSTAYPEDGADEDNTYAKFSPSASFQITIANPALIGKFAVGDTFYVDFTPAPS